MVKGSWKMNRGASLPIVLAILFSLLPLSMVLISLSDNGMQGVLVEHKRFQELYKAEAAIYAKLYALPIKNLFNVRIEENGFWDKACVNLFQGELCAVYGYGFENYHFLKNNLELQEAFKSRLLSLKNTLYIQDTLYGNRYFERLPSECFAVENGDVRVQLDSSLNKACIFCSGDILFRGRGSVDTLMLFGGGAIRLEGEWRMRHLEAHTSEKISLTTIKFQGVVSAREVALENRTIGEYPSVIALMPASWNGKTSLEFQYGSHFIGTLWNAEINSEMDILPDKNIKANLLGFSKDWELKKDIPMPAFFGAHSETPIILEWL